MFFFISKVWKYIWVRSPIKWRRSTKSRHNIYHWNPLCKRKLTPRLLFAMSSTRRKLCGLEVWQYQILANFRDFWRAIFVHKSRRIQNFDLKFWRQTFADIAVYLKRNRIKRVYIDWNNSMQLSWNWRKEKNEIYLVPNLKCHSRVRCSIYFHPNDTNNVYETKETSSRQKRVLK